MGEIDLEATVGWDMECTTCFERATADLEPDELPLAKADVEAWRQGHRCQPVFELITPAQLDDERRRVRVVRARIEEYERGREASRDGT